LFYVSFRALKKSAESVEMFFQAAQIMVYVGAPNAARLFPIQNAFIDASKFKFTTMRTNLQYTEVVMKVNSKGN